MASKREALNSCGRLKKGYRFRKGGGILAARKMGKAKGGRRRRKATQGSLF